LNPEITSIIDVSRIPQKLIETELNISLKPVLVLEMLTVASSKKFYRKKIKYEQRRL
jgi:hypothetical protein